MKYLNYFFLAAMLTCLHGVSSAQTINWKNLQPRQKHLINLNAGLDNGTVIGIVYGYHLGKPLVLGLESSLPFGKDAFDDFKTKIGGQLNLVRTNSFFTTVKAYSIIRRFHNDFARLMSFGSEFSATAGIYKNNWFAAAELGFDKAITTHVKHSDLMKQYNPEVQSGWYIPTGGNFLYGVQGGYSFNRYDVYAKIGKTRGQDLKSAPMIPLYFQLGWNMRW